MDVVIPVHRADRPIGRAVASVLAASAQGVRALVVCHNIDGSQIEARLEPHLADPRLRLIECRDGGSSPSGPRNAGIEASDADYLAFLDSDDEIEAGALDAWVDELRGSPDLLIGQELIEGRGRVLAPAPRPGRFDRLHPVRDRLNDRTAPVGVLMRRELAAGPRSPRYVPEFRTGEDLALGLYLWNTARDIRYSRCAAGYLVHEAAVDRVTGGSRAAGRLFAPLRHAIALPVLRELPRRRRQSIAAKLLRHQVLGRLRGLSARGELGDAAIAEAAETAAELLRFAPGAGGFLSRGEVRCLRELAGGDAAAFERAEAAARRVPYRWRAIPQNPLRIFAPEAPLSQTRRSRLTPRHLRAPELRGAQRAAPAPSSKESA